MESGTPPLTAFVLEDRTEPVAPCLMEQQSVCVYLERSKEKIGLGRFPINNGPFGMRSEQPFGYHSRMLLGQTELQNQDSLFLEKALPLGVLSEDIRYAAQQALLSGCLPEVCGKHEAEGDSVFAFLPDQKGKMALEYPVTFSAANTSHVLEIQPTDLVAQILDLKVKGYQITVRELLESLFDTGLNLRAHGITMPHHNAFNGDATRKAHNAVVRNLVSQPNIAEIQFGHWLNQPSMGGS